MRISDWSSDVCSSELVHVPLGGQAVAGRRQPEAVGQVPLEQRRVLAADARPAAGEGVLAAPGRGRVDDDRHLAQPGGDGRGGVLDVHLEAGATRHRRVRRSEEHTSELQSLMRISYAVFCLKKKNTTQT